MLVIFSGFGALYGATFVALCTEASDRDADIAADSPANNAVPLGGRMRLEPRGDFCRLVGGAVDSVTTN